MMAGQLVLIIAAVLAGTVVMIANWPYMPLVIMPSNRRLMATEPREAGPESRRLIRHWARPHALRTALGLTATLLFLLASLARNQGITQGGDIPHCEPA